MKKNHVHNLWKVYFSFFIVVILQIISFLLQQWYFQPSLIMIWLIYWNAIFPYQINIGTGFCVGLVLDIVLDTVLGTNSLSLSILSYYLTKKMQFFRYFSVFLQIFYVIFFSFIYHGIVFLIECIINNIIFFPKIFWICILDGSIWLIFIFLCGKTSLNKKIEY